MPVRNRSLLARVLVLMASAAFSVGVVECAFRLFAISYPELSADLFAAGQSAPGASDSELRADVIASSGSAPKAGESEPRPDTQSRHRLRNLLSS